MVYENPEKDALYTIFDGDVAELADRLTSFCNSIYGEKCEFYTVSIERNRDGGSWKLHEFPNFDGRAVKAIKNHLSARRDQVRVQLGGEDEDYRLEFLVCPARNTESLARYVEREHQEEFDQDALVVLAVLRSGEGFEEQREFMENIEK